MEHEPASDLTYSIVSTNSLSEFMGEVLPVQRVTCSVVLDGKNYSLVVETQDEYTNSIWNEKSEGDYSDDLSEPVLMLPEDGITQENLERALYGMEPGLLKTYLVEQTGENLDS